MPCCQEGASCRDPPVLRVAPHLLPQLASLWPYCSTGSSGLLHLLGHTRNYIRVSQSRYCHTGVVLYNLYFFSFSFIGVEEEIPIIWAITLDTLLSRMENYKKTDKSESFSELTGYYKNADWKTVHHPSSWNFVLALRQLRFVSFCMTTGPLQSA